MTTLDINLFKTSLKDFAKDHPGADMEQFVDFCESLIPPHQFTMYQWLVEQASSWYEFVLSQQSSSSIGEEE